VRNWGAGAHYTFGPVTANALYTAVRNEMNGASVWQAELGGMWLMAPEWVLSGAYMYMKGNQVVDNNHAHQVTGMLTYFLSKRTSVYVAGVYQRTNQGANAQINDVMVASSGPSQFIGRVGLQARRHWSRCPSRKGARHTARSAQAWAENRCRCGKSARYWRTVQPARFRSACICPTGRMVCRMG